MTQEQKPKQPESVEDKFKFQLIYLMPILASLGFGLGCAYLLAPQQQVSIGPVTPFPETTPGAPIGNALYFVILIAISAVLFYFLIKRRSKRVIKTLIILSMSTASLLLSWFYLTAIFSYYPDGMIFLIPLMIIITVLFDFAIFKFGGVVRNIAVIGLGGALGIFLGNQILIFAGLWSVVLILAFLAVYDVIAVYKGPVGKIAESSGGLDELQGLSFSFKDIQMGLGDLVFYSVLMGTVFFNFLPSVLPTIMAVVGILAGSIITFFMLEKKGIFPGLPFPIMLGLALGLLSGFFFPLF